MTENVPTGEPETEQVRMIETLPPPIILTREQAEENLRAALRVSARYHTYSVAQLLGIYPA